MRIFLEPNDLLVVPSFMGMGSRSYFLQTLIKIHMSGIQYTLCTDNDDDDDDDDEIIME